MHGCDPTYSLDFLHQTLHGPLVLQILFSNGIEEVRLCVCVRVRVCVCVRVCALDFVCVCGSG